MNKCKYCGATIPKKCANGFCGNCANKLPLVRKLLRMCKIEKEKCVKAKLKSIRQKIVINDKEWMT